MGSVVSSVAGAFGIDTGQTQGGKGISEQAGQLQLELMRQKDMLKGLQPQQDELGQALAASALGKEGSLAQAQLKASQDRTLAQQLALARSGRGVNPALAGRMQAKLGSEVAQQNAQNAINAQRSAQQDFSNYLGQQQNYFGNIAQSSTQAAASRAANDQNQQSAQNQVGGSFLNSAMGGAAMMMSDVAAKKNIKPVKMAMGGMVASSPTEGDSGPQGPSMGDKFLQGFQDTMKASSEKQQQQQAAQMPGSLIQTNAPQLNLSNAFQFGSALGQKAASGSGGDSMSTIMKLAPLMAMSDKLSKKNVSANYNSGGVVKGKEIVKEDSEKNDIVDAKLSAGEMVIPKTVVQKGAEEVKQFAKETLKPQTEKQPSASSFLDALQSYSYEYKDSKNGKGKHVSVMAQDLEKAGPVGKSMVMDTPEGKVVDYGKGFGAILAAQTELNQRLKKLESKKR